MEYTPQHQMFDQKRLQILNMYNNAPDILKGKEDNESEDEEDELEFEDEEEVEKGEEQEIEEDSDNSEEEEVEKGESTELTKSEAFDILESPFELDLVKGGEGSKGGKVIGHTKSGKPIYDSHNHESHKDFSSEDHKDAAKIHTQEYNDHKEDFDSYKKTGQANHSEARESKGKMEYHKEQARLHKSK